MSEKEEALQHLSDIKSVLVDKDAFFPYNYNALIVWGVIGMIMSLFMGVIFKASLLYGAIFSFVVTTAGFMIEGFLVKKVNEAYDIEDCTKRQKFISIMFSMLTFFAIALSVLLAKHDLIIPAYAVWIFLIGMGNFALGFILNIKIFTLASYLKMSVAILIMIATLFVGDLGSLDSMFFFFVQGVTFALLGVLPILIARKLKKEL
ncbi:MAG TPA: hypothetical protein EYG75_02280 [Campylobacterales bacterium]|nr:hypothetical protein [Campylobacterales bacterium]